MNYPQDLLTPIKKYLEQKKVELLDRKARLKAEDPFADPERLNNNAAVDADAVEQFGHDTVSAMETQIEQSIIEVERSLTRITDGTYGSCAGCGSMIDTDRLTIDPTAEYCVDCQRKKTIVS